MFRKNRDKFDPIEFRNEFNEQYRLVSRLIYVLLFLSLVLFSVWDMFVIGFDHPALAEFILKRYLIAMPLLFIGFALTFIDFKYIHLDWIMTFACWAVGISVIEIYILFYEIGREITIDGLMLFMLCIYFIPSIFAYQKIGVGLFTLTAYIFFLWVSDRELSVFIHAIIYLGLINLGGAVQCLTLDKKLKENFVSQRILKKMAHTDHLTGAHNRHKFEDDFNQLIKVAKKEQAFVGLFIVDIDHFKEFNDHYGHLEGDDCLVAIAKALLAKCEHPLDRCIRFGGEEFILVKYAHSEEELSLWGQSLLEAVCQLKIEHEYSRTSSVVTVSIGAAFLSKDDDISRAELMAKADKALYLAKQSGRNRMQVAG